VGQTKEEREKVCVREDRFREKHILIHRLNLDIYTFAFCGKRKKVYIVTSSGIRKTQAKKKYSKTNQ
jgi:hypothetical protein